MELLSQVHLSPQVAVEMSLTSKCVCAAAGPGQPCVQDQDQDQPPPTGTEGRTQVTAVAASDDQGDPEIIKSPSDPKKYR